MPFSTFAEAVGTLAVFEILKEAGTRTPDTIGQALSIVGGLVLGQAAVDARFVSAPMVIIIAFSGVTALIVPKLRTATLLLRFFLLVCAGAVGVVWRAVRRLLDFGAPVPPVLVWRAVSDQCARGGKAQPARCTAPISMVCNEAGASVSCGMARGAPMRRAGAALLLCLLLCGCSWKDAGDLSAVTAGTISRRDSNIN